MIFTNIEPVGKFVKREFFRIMFIQIGTDFLKFREDTVGMSVSIFFFLPEKKLGGKAVQQFVFQQLPVAARVSSSVRSSSNSN